jgi:hypothetical protein
MNAFSRLLLVGSWSVVAWAAACANQGEGERCSPSVAGDCQADLTCRTFPALAYGVCCPPVGQSTVPSCNPGVVTADAGAADAPADGDAADGAVVSSEDAGAE